MRMIHRAMASSALALALAAQGCATATLPDSNVRSEWGSDIARLGLVGFYPPREDVYVGDLYLQIPDACNAPQGSPIISSVFLGTLGSAEINHLFQEFYRDRPMFPTSPTKEGSDKAADKAADKTEPAAGADPTAQTAQSGAKSGEQSSSGRPSGQTTVPATTPPPSTARQGQTGTPAAQTATATPTKATAPTIDIQIKAPGSQPISVSIPQAATPPASATPDTAPDKADDKDKTKKNAAAPKPDEPVLWLQPDGTPRTDQRVYTRNRQVVFPTLKLGSISSTDLSVSAPGGSFAKLLGGVSSNAEKKVQVSVNAVELSQLPAPTVYQLLKTYAGTDRAAMTFNKSFISRIYAETRGRSLSAGGPDCVKKNENVFIKPSLVVLYQVYYARTFDYDFGSTSGTTSHLQAELLEKAAKNSAPGVDLTVGTSSTGSIVLKQTLDRPLAFGVGGALVFDLFEFIDIVEAARGSAPALSAGGVLPTSGDSRAIGYRPPITLINDQVQTPSDRFSIEKREATEPDVSTAPTVSAAEVSKLCDKNPYSPGSEAWLNWVRICGKDGPGIGGPGGPTLSVKDKLFIKNFLKEQSNATQ